jgi:hypothetical protein
VLLKEHAGSQGGIVVTKSLAKLALTWWIIGPSLAC